MGEEFCSTLAGARGYSTAWIGRPDPERGEVVLVASGGPEPGPCPHGRITWDEATSGLGPVGTALRERRTVTTLNPADDPGMAPWRGEAGGWGSVSLTSFPLICRGRLLGVLTLKYDRSRALESGEIELLEELSALLAQAWDGFEQESVLLRTREEFETLIESMPDAVFLKDGEGRWRIINTSAEQLFQVGRRPHPWHGRSDLELAEDLPEMRAAHLACLESDRAAWEKGGMSQAEERILAPDGTTIIFDVCKIPSFHPDGRRKGLVVIGRNVTQAHQADAQIRLLQAAAEAAANGIVMTDTGGKVIWFNRAFAEMNEYDQHGILGQDLACLREGQHPSGFYQELRRGLARGTKWGTEVVVRHRERGVRTLRLTVSPASNAGGQVTHWIAIQEDISEKKRAEQELRETNARLEGANAELERHVGERTRELAEAKERMERIFTCSPVGLVIVRWQDRTFVQLNQAFADLFGCRRDEMVGRTLADFRLGEDKTESKQLRDSLLAHGRVRSFATRARRKDGSEMEIEISADLIRMDASTCLLANVMDVTERRKAERAAEQASLRIEDLYNRAPCGYHSINAGGRITQINDTELAWLGYARKEVLGRPVTDLLTAASRALFHDRFPGFLESGRVSDLEVEFVRRDGTTFPTLLHSTAIFDQQGRFIESRTTTVDNTERRKIELQMREALEVAAAANRTKSEFLANMSHEIRTPMNAILGHAQLIQSDPSIPVEIREQMNVICRSGQALLTLLNNILELSRIEAGRGTLKLVAFSPADLLDDLRSLYHARAVAKHLSLTFFTPPSLPRFVEGDQEKIRQGVNNLLSNALKFTSVGGVQLRVEALPCSTGECRLLVEVQDTGPGIPAAAIPHLCERFGQTGTGLETPGGSGLGLYLTRQYARLMGGDLTVTSETGRGSAFRFEVLVKPCVPPAGVRADPLLPSLRRDLDAPGYRVLVADDLADNREVLQMLLERVGFEVRTAVNGTEAIRLCGEWLPQLVLMDAWMPGMDGYEASRRLRADAAIPQPRIIMVSASAFEDDRVAAIHAGADDFVAKPYGGLDLLERIRGLLRCEFLPRTPAGEQAAPPPSCPLTPEATGLLLPAPLRASLRNAVLIGDFDRLNLLVEQVRETAPVVAETLATLAHQFNAAELLRLVPE